MLLCTTATCSAHHPSDVDLLMYDDHHTSRKHAHVQQKLQVRLASYTLFLHIQQMLLYSLTTFSTHHSTDVHLLMYGIYLTSGTTCTLQHNWCIVIIIHYLVFIEHMLLYTAITCSAHHSTGVDLLMYHDSHTSRKTYTYRTDAWCTMSSIHHVDAHSTDDVAYRNYTFRSPFNRSWFIDVWWSSYIRNNMSMYNKCLMYDGQHT